VKIIPQKNSPLNIDYYENQLQIRLDQINIKDKNNKLNALDKALPKILNQLKKEAIISEKTSDYAGVDLWSFINNNKQNIAFKNYENTIIIATDGYLDFENDKHVLRKGNQFTSTKFIKYIINSNWKTIAQNKNYGIIPITISTNATWIISGIKSKRPNDLMQINKLKFFWNKWIIESSQSAPIFINYSSQSQIISELNAIIN